MKRTFARARSTGLMAFGSARSTMNIYVFGMIERELSRAVGSGRREACSAARARIEADRYEPTRCQLIEPNNQCYESCVRRELAAEPPEYDIRAGNRAPALALNSARCLPGGSFKGVVVNVEASVQSIRPMSRTSIILRVVFLLACVLALSVGLMAFED